MNGKRPPSHLATVHPPFLPTHEASARLCATSTRLLPFHSLVLERTFPLPGPQTPYLSLSTFKAGPNASSSMKLSLNPHLALVLAESVAPMACVCISITALIPLDYKSLCVICLLRRLPAPSGQEFSYSLEGSQCLAIITACCKEWTFQQMFPEFCWMDLRKLKVLIFDNCSL